VAAPVPCRGFGDEVHEVVASVPIREGPVDVAVAFVAAGHEFVMKQVSGGIVFRAADGAVPVSAEGVDEIGGWGGGHAFLLGGR
jgi:hypothetical protein